MPISSLPDGYVYAYAEGDGGFHKVHHAIFDQFLPPLPSVTVCHTSRDPLKVRHTPRTPPNVSSIKVRTKTPCTKISLNGSRGFCSEVLSGRFCPG